MTETLTRQERARVRSGCCPYCGSADLSTEERSDYTKEFYSVYCECSECNASYVVYYAITPSDIERFE